MQTLKDLRLEKKLTQQQAAMILGVSLRSYKSYENDENKRHTLKYNYMEGVLRNINPIDEEHGILEIDDIKNTSAKILDKYNVEFCYLFGSYAKNKAEPASDIDMLVSTSLKGLKYYEMVEELRTSLHKKVDILDLDQLKDNIELTTEILRDGIKIYG